MAPALSPSFSFAAANTHRDTLGLGLSFTQADLRTSYRGLIRKHHPDRFAGDPEAEALATERTKALNLAYEFLSEVLDTFGGRFPSAEFAGSQTGAPPPTESERQPRRRYNGKTYQPGFPDPSVVEVFLKSTCLLSTGYNRATRTLYLKFDGGAVYRYFSVPVEVFEALLDAPSQGAFANQNITRRYRFERC